MVPAAIVCALAVGAVVRGLSFAGVSHGSRRTGIGPGRVSVLHVPSADTDVPIRDVWVYRPAVADSRTVPVVYFLHGVPGSASDLFGQGGAAVLDRMFETGTPPFVLAAPTGTGHAHVDTEWADSADRRDRVETYLIDRVIPTVEGRDRRDASHRFLAGFSMGGYGAANLALRHPDMFSGAASFAGYFHIDDPDHMFDNNKRDEAANDPGLLVRKVRSVHFFIADGTSDREPVVQGEARRFAALAGNLVAHGDLVLGPGGHNYAFVFAHFPNLGAFVARMAHSP